MIPAQNPERTQFAYDVSEDAPAKIIIKVTCKEKKEKPGVVPSYSNGSVVVNTEEKNDPENSIPKHLTRDQIIANIFSNLKDTTVPGENVLRTPNLKQNGIVIEYANTSYSFEIIENDDVHEDTFFDLKIATVPYENSYTLIINLRCGAFDGASLNTSFKDLIIVIALSMALARITGESSGLKLDQSRIFMDKFNHIIAKTKK